MRVQVLFISLALGSALAAGAPCAQGAPPGDEKNMKVTPAPGTWLVRGGDGESVFKLQILSYYSNPDGSAGMAGGRYLVRVATLVP